MLYLQLEALCGQDACSVLVQEIYALCDASEFYSAGKQSYKDTNVDTLYEI